MDNKLMSLVFSAVQPTGKIHLGNYLGAIKQWTTLQNEYPCIFSVADLHAITIHKDSNDLKNSIYETVATYIACGINPNKSPIYVQSSIVEHTVLSWILSCHAKIGQMNRMTQYKDKSSKNQENATLGLYSYPVLMAADILLFNASHVPVGEDQKQHLELTRDIALSFNKHYNKEVFTIPEPLILNNVARIMSLKDGNVKMSKSDHLEHSRITLRDTIDDIAAKIKKAKTDSLPLPETVEDLNTRPEIKNLYNIYSAINDVSLENTIRGFIGEKTSIFKQALIETLSSNIISIGNKIAHLMNDKAHLDFILTDGKNMVQDKARINIETIKETIGLY